MCSIDTKIPNVRSPKLEEIRAMFLPYESIYTGKNSISRLIIKHLDGWILDNAEIYSINRENDTYVHHLHF